MIPPLLGMVSSSLSDIDGAEVRGHTPWYYRLHVISRPSEQVFSTAVLQAAGENKERIMGAPLGANTSKIKNMCGNGHTE